MHRNNTSRTERIGVHRVALSVTSELKWIWRDQTVDDYGIDGHIELVDDDEIVTGRLVGVQVKSGDSHLKRVVRSKTEPGWSYWADRNHLAYWLGHCLPVVVTFVDSTQRIYWQVVTPNNITETSAGFSVWVPDSNRLDATARDAIRTFATSWRSLQARLPDHYHQLPTTVAKILQRAEGTDGFAVARLAEMLATGSSASCFTAESILASSPTWLVDSPVVEDLWFAVAAFSSEHEHDWVASRAYTRAAGVNGPRRGRALAYAGLSVITRDRGLARPFLIAATEHGEGLLAAVGTCMLDVPVDDARAVPIPEPIASAPAADIENQPTILNFLGEMALRNNNIAEAIRYRELAVAASPGPGSSLNLPLATTLWRDVREGGDRYTSRRRRAIALVQETIETRRRWQGPSGVALELLLDVFITAGMFTEALRAALPYTHGGTALTNEITLGVARRGGVAALALGDYDSVNFFKQALGDTPECRELAALEQDGPPATDAERVERWTALLDDAPDDAMRSRIIARIVRLGTWPDAADDMETRSVLPLLQMDSFRAIYVATAPGQDRQLGLSRLRDLARRSSLAAVELVNHLENTGPPQAAIDASEEFTRLWGDTVLAEQLTTLYWRHGDPERAVALVKQYILDEAFSVDARTTMCHAAVTHLIGVSKYSDAVEMARAGLAVNDDPDLAWSLAACLHNLGRIPEARNALRRHRPQPTTQQERRLWLELHLGTPLEVPDAQTLLGLVQQEADGPFRAQLTAHLTREVLHVDGPDSITYPDELTVAVTALRDAQPADGTADDEHGLDSDEVLRTRVARAQPTPGEYRKMLTSYSEGRLPLADVAEAMNYPWGSAILQRPVGVQVVSDLTPGLRHVGRRAARQARDAHTCVVDLSALYTLSSLTDDDRLRIRGELPTLLLPAPFAHDASRTRAQVRAIFTTGKTVGIDSSGRTAWITPSLTERAHLMREAGLLEMIVASSTTAIVPSGTPYDQLTKLAQRLRYAVWCDDSAARQRLRGRGLPTFSTFDLLDELSVVLPLLNVNVARQQLALHFVVDLPLTGGQVAMLGKEYGWGTSERWTPAQAVLLRPGWWSSKNRQMVAPDNPRSVSWSASWQDDWKTVVEAAASESPLSLTSACKAAIQGLRASVTSGLQTQQHFRLLVLTLDTCHRVGASPPGQLSVDLEAVVPAGSAPDPRIVRSSLAVHLHSRGVEDADEAAYRLLPGVPV